MNVPDVLVIDVGGSRVKLFASSDIAIRADGLLGVEAVGPRRSCRKRGVRT